MRTIVAIMMTALVFCSSNNPGSAPSIAPVDDIPTIIGQYRKEAVAYSLRGDTIYVISSKRESDSCASVYQHRISLKPVPFTFVGDSLRIFLNVVDTIGTPDNIVDFYKTFTRISEGSAGVASIYGVWKLTGEGFVTKSPLTQGDSITAIEIQTSLHGGFNYLRINTYDITIYHLVDSLRSFAWNFMQDWNRYYAYRVEVTVDTTLNPNSLVVLAGLVDHDTVRIVLDPSGRILTTSQDTARHSFVYDPLSHACPNPMYPVWFESVFLINNLKVPVVDTVPSIAIISPKSGDTLFVGDTIRVSLDFDSLFKIQNSGISISLSIDGGIEWYALTCVESGFPQIRLDKPYSRNPSLFLPDSLKRSNPNEPKISPVSGDVLFEVVSYTNHTARAQTDGRITVLPAAQKPAR